MDKRVYKIALGLLEGIGIANTKIMISYAGGLESVFTFSDKALAELCGLSLKKVKNFNRKAALERAEKELDFVDQNGIQLHYYQDKNYPPKLKFCEDGPLLLYSKGNVDFNKQNIAVVGTRKATAYGKSLTQQLIKNLAPRGVQIVSGLAHGIDKEAHEAALNNGLSTIAVLGHGLDMIYPAAHKKLAHQLLENGGLVSEFMSSSPLDPSNFPKRNRIVAGLSDATVVIESAASGGSLITADLAFNYNREVFAFPGNVDHMNSAGCHLLIQQEKARLITSAADMIPAMGWDEIKTQLEPETDLFDALTAEEEALIKILKKHKMPLHIDYLAEEVNCAVHELSMHLFNLQIRGMVDSLPGNRYVLIP